MQARRRLTPRLTTNSRQPRTKHGALGVDAAVRCFAKALASGPEKVRAENGPQEALAFRASIRRGTGHGFEMVVRVGAYRVRFHGLFRVWTPHYQTRSQAELSVEGDRARVLFSPTVRNACGTMPHPVHPCDRTARTGEGPFGTGEATFARWRSVFMLVPKTKQSQACPGFQKRIIHTGIAWPSYPRACFAARTSER